MPPTVVEVLPDVSGLDRTFHYLADDDLSPGTIVRVPLHGRRLRGWVLETGSSPPAGVEARPLIAVVSEGPTPEAVDLARWAAWRYSGRLRPLLLAGSPERIVAVGSSDRRDPVLSRREGPSSLLAAEAVAARDAIVRLPPAAERLPLVDELLREASPLKGALVLVESHDDLNRLSSLLAKKGWPVARYPEEWAACDRAVVVGTRNAAFAPGSPSLVVVLDAHSDAYRSERAPNFDAREVVAERARRVEAAVVYVTPCPPVTLLSSKGRRLLTVGETGERLGWGAVSVFDSRSDDPAEGGYPSALVSLIRESAGHGRPVVCILNRVGRARLLACAACRQMQRCESCGAALAQREAAEAGRLAVLACPRCGATARALCPACGSGRLQIVRPGVSRAREQLSAVTGLPVGEMSGPKAEVPGTPVIVATQSALHRLRSAALVVWLDLDQELLAARYRASEEAMALLARSVRLTGSRAGGSRLVLRTSIPDHEVVRAVVSGDPGIVASAELERRRLLELPPFSAVARLSGEGAAEAGATLANRFRVVGVGDEVIVRASEAAELADALAELAEHSGGWGAASFKVETGPLDL